MTRAKTSPLARWAPIAVLALVPVGVLAAQPVPVVPPRPTTVDAAAVQRLACPISPLSGMAVAAAGEGDVVPTALHEDQRDAAGPSVVQGKPGQPVAASYFASGKATAWAAPCVTPSADAWLITPTPKSSTLYLVNSDGTEASANLTMLGSEGDITSPGSAGIRVAARSGRSVPLSVLANTDGVVAARVTTDHGRVAAYAWTDQTAGDLVAPQALASRQVIPGIPAGATSVTLLLANPGQDRVTVQVDGLTPDGRIPLDGGSVEVPAGRTATVNLTSGVADQSMVLDVKSSDDVVAAAIVKLGVDVAALTPVDPEERDAFGGAAPAAGTVQVANPTDSDATIDVTVGSSTQQVQLRAGASTQVRVPQGWVRVASPGVGALLTTAQGFGVVRLSPLPDVGAPVVLAPQPAVGR